MRNWSEEQQVFFDLLMSGCYNVTLESVAGSGKTSVGVEGATHLPYGSKYLAFNKKIASELERRLPEGMASTFHKYCLNYLRGKMKGRFEINGNKMYGLLANYHKEQDEAAREIVRLVGLLKNNGAGLIAPNTMEFALDLCANYDISHEKIDVEVIAKTAISLLKKNSRDLSVIDFDDMLYLPLQMCMEYGWKLPQIPAVVQDEAQDTNPLQVALLLKMTENLISLGDSHQSIYGFRGAGTDSMAVLAEQFGTQRAMMSISWRCPKAVAEEAKVWVPYFKAAPNAIEGRVLHKHIAELYGWIDDESMVICRNNFPLFSVAIQLLRQRVRFQMTGNYPKRLIGFVKSFKANHIQEFRVRLTNWWTGRKEELESKGKWGLLANEEDKYNCLQELQAHCESMDELTMMLSEMMMGKSGPLLTTVHGAKGLEAKTVCVLRPDLMPSKYAKTEQDFQQEENLMYVAATRALETLVYFEVEEM